MVTVHLSLAAAAATAAASVPGLSFAGMKQRHANALVWKQFQGVQIRVAYLEQSMVERSIVSRQEALIRDLENKLEFQSVQIKRFEVLLWASLPWLAWGGRRRPLPKVSVCAPYREMEGSGYLPQNPLLLGVKVPQRDRSRCIWTDMFVLHTN